MNNWFFASHTDEELIEHINTYMVEKEGDNEYIINILEGEGEGCDVCFYYDRVREECIK
jgi:hypothetical protein